MFLLSSLILLFIVAWLFFNALNEKRWVDAHRHDETVAADPGILPDLSQIFGGGDSGSVIEKTGARLKSTASDVTSNLKQRAGDENDPIGRVVAKGSEMREKARNRLN